MNTHRIERRWSNFAALTFACALAAVACATAEDDSSQFQPDGSGASGGSSGAGGSAATGGSSTGGGAGTTSGGSGGSSGTGGSTEDGGSDASAGAAGTGGDAGSSGTGGAAGDAGTDADAGPCTPNTVQMESCGKCGKRDRLCDANGKWGDWGFCYGETGECVPNSQLTESCGKCGTITYYCSASCIYLPGSCSGEGTCSTGEIAVSNAGCAAGEVRTAICTNQCTPGTFGNCSTQYTWTTVAPSPLSGRRQASSAWNGKYLVVAGGYGSSPTYKDDSALYDPATNQWTMLPPWPTGATGRRNPAIGANANYIVIWGGYGTSPTYKDDGIVYSFATQSWTVMSKVGHPGPRHDNAYAWDEAGQQLLVFGGSSTSTTTYTNTLHAYKPATDSWTALPAAPIVGRREMAFAWDPDRRWLYVYGGYSGGYKDDGAIYDATANEWRLLPPVPAGFTAREQAGAGVASDKFVIFGGYGSSPTYKLDGLVYDPITHKWTKLPTPPIGARTEMFSASNGTSVIFWGGREATTATKEDGAIFNPATMTWTGITSGPLVQSPPSRYWPVGAWTPQGIVIWGGAHSTTYMNDGRVYEP